MIISIRNLCAVGLASSLFAVWGCAVEEQGPSEDIETRALLKVDEKAPNFGCIVDCALEAAICADEALVRQAKCNKDTCLRDAHREHAAALLACKKKHAGNPQAILQCSSAADDALIKAREKCPTVKGSEECQKEYEKDQKACDDAFDECTDKC